MATALTGVQRSQPALATRPVAESLPASAAAAFSATALASVPPNQAERPRSCRDRDRVLRANKERVAAQQGVAGMSTLKTLLTAAALGATAYSRVLGQRVSAAENPPSKRGTKPSKRAKALAPDVAAAQEQLDTLQWVIPALTGALVALSSYAGEQQRPSEVAQGISSPATSTAP